MKKYILILVSFIILLLSFGCGGGNTSVENNTSTPITKVAQQIGLTSGEANLVANVIKVDEKSVKTIHKDVPLEIFTLDIGQGDAHLIRSGNDFYLIDTGDVEHRDFIVARLKAYGIKSFKGIILTHGDSDHLGGFWAIAQNFEIENVYDNGFEKKSTVYKTYRRTLNKKNIPRKTLKQGDELELGNEVKFIVYAPWENPILDKKGKIDPNNNSMVGKLVFNKFSMLFTGDAGKEEEDRLIKAQNSKLFSRILKVAHHGSNGSSQDKFIRSVKPEVSVISVGLNNEYGHPGDKTLSRLSNENSKILRTDLQGTINIQTDGKIWSFLTER